jgi:adenylate cyclase
VPVHSVERKLAAIFAADIAGYSRLMARDEVDTLTRLRTCRAIVDELIASHRGRIFNTAGDSVVADFASAVDAVQCAVAVQAAIATENAGAAADEPMQFRIGVHVGDIMVDGENLLGDAVNIAARLESLAEPGSIYVSAAARDHIGNKLPLGFNDLGDQQVKNIAQAIRVYRVQVEKPAAQPVAPLPLPDKPSIAVLPFQNMSAGPEQEYFADGMVEEIITALSKIRWLFVIARNSTVTYKGQDLGAKKVGRDLGVRYVLEGSVRKSGNRVRITAQLIDAGTSVHLWAGRFDGSLEDVFDLQDQIATNVAGIIEPALQAAEIRRSAARPTTDLTAYDLYLRALAVYYPITKERTLAALKLLDRAIEIDPNYGPALSWAAVCHWQCVTDGWAEQAEISRRKAIDRARQALEATQNDDPGVLANVAFILANFGEDIGAMIGLVDRALALNPSFARGWNVSGLLRLYAGELDRAIEHVEASLRLSPRERIGTPLVVIGLAYFFQRRFDQALAKLLLATQENPGSPATYRILAACYAHMERMAEAQEAIAQLRAITPLVMPSTLPWRIPEHRELLLSGLRLAGGEGS